MLARGRWRAPVGEVATGVRVLARLLAVGFDGEPELLPPVRCAGNGWVLEGRDVGVFCEGVDWAALSLGVETLGRSARPARVGSGLLGSWDLGFAFISVVAGAMGRSSFPFTSFTSRLGALVVSAFGGAGAVSTWGAGGTSALSTSTCFSFTGSTGCSAFSAKLSAVASTDSASFLGDDTCAGSCRAAVLSAVAGGDDGSDEDSLVMGDSSCVEMRRTEPPMLRLSRGSRAAAVASRLAAI